MRLFDQQVEFVGARSTDNPQQGSQVGDRNRIDWLDCGVEFDPQILPVIDHHVVIVVRP